MTINVAEAVRKVMGWCPNATMVKSKSSQQIDFVNTSLKPAGKMNSRKSKRLLIGIVPFFVILAFTYYIGQLLWGIIVITLVFWLIMLSDCLQRNKDNFPGKGEYDKLIWSITIIFLNFIGAMLYYYLVKIQENRVEMT